MFENEFRKNLWSYVLGRTSLEQFKDWLFPTAWDFEKGADQPVIDLVNKVKLLLAELSSGHRDEPELKNEFFLLLAPLAPPQELMYSIEVPSASIHEAAKPVPKSTGTTNTDMVVFECTPA